MFDFRQMVSKMCDFQWISGVPLECQLECTGKLVIRPLKQKKTTQFDDFVLGVRVLPIFPLWGPSFSYKGRGRGFCGCAVQNNSALRVLLAHVANCDMQNVFCNYAL